MVAHYGHARAQSRLGFAYQNGLFNQTIDDEEALKSTGRRRRVATTTLNADSDGPTRTATWAY